MRVLEKETSVRRKIGDRRIRPRFDIVGDLWGSLETVLQLPLRNVSRGGALIHSHVPLPSQSVHRLAFNSDGQDVSVPVRVSHVDTQMSADGERTYLIGVEFLSRATGPARDDRPVGDCRQRRSWSVAP